MGAVFAATLIIAIDPGSAMGWSVFRVRDGCATRVESGVCKTKGEWGARFNAALAAILDLIVRHRRSDDVVALAYEDVRIGAYRSFDGATVIAGMIGAIYQAAHLAKIPTVQILTVPVTSAKLHWTGNGKAKKAEMKARFTELYEEKPASDDEADACAMASWAWEVLNGRVPHPDTVVYKRLTAHYDVDHVPRKKFDAVHGAPKRRTRKKVAKTRGKRSANKVPRNRVAA